MSTIVVDILLDQVLNISNDIESKGIAFIWPREYKKKRKGSATMVKFV